MKQLALVLLALAPMVAQAQSASTAPAANSDGREIRLNHSTPPATGQRGTVMTDIRPVPTTPSATSPSTTVAADPTAGFPSIPAAGPAGASSPAPSTGTVPAPGPLAPVKAYATLAEAAQAGIDPLKELEVSVAPPQVKAEPTAPAAFNWKDPLSYLAWAKANQAMALKYAAGVLVAALAASLFMRKRKP